MKDCPVCRNKKFKKVYHPNGCEDYDELYKCTACGLVADSSDWEILSPASELAHA